MTVLVNKSDIYSIFILTKYRETVIRQAIVFILLVLPVQKWTPGVYRLQNIMPGNGL